MKQRMFKQVLTMMACILSVAGTCFASTIYEGIVIPVHDVELALPIDGVLANVFVKEGDYVKQGDQLLKLDDTLQRLEVGRKRAIYEDLAEYEANRANLVILKSILESTRLLYEKTASVSQVELKNLEMQYYNLQGRIAAQEAKKVQEQMDYEIAREVLARYVLISPLNGMVTVIRRETGEWVRAGEMIVSAVDTSICHAEFNVEEKHARLLKKGKIVSLKVSEGNGLNSRKGTIFFVSSVADKASALIKVKVEFENMTGKVIPGVLAQLALD